MQTYDALLIVAFGGPEHRDDVLPFLENVLRGRNVPQARMLEVAEHYYRFDGISPLNGQIRDLIRALRVELDASGIAMPIYWGNRNWNPLLTDTLLEMQRDGVRHAMAFATSAFSSYSGCRQYREDIAHAQLAIGAPEVHVDKLRVFFDHPGYIETMECRVRDAIATLPKGSGGSPQLIFTAHSIPATMAECCDYELQLREASQLVADRIQLPWQLVFQSRSGPPTQLWLEPDVCDALRRFHHKTPNGRVILVPIGFLSDHMEVKFDLDHEAAAVCHELGLPMARAATAGTHTRFVSMIRELIQERLEGLPPNSLGTGSTTCHLCTSTCCWPGRPGFVPHEKR